MLDVQQQKKLEDFYALFHVADDGMSAGGEENDMKVVFDKDNKATKEQTDFFHLLMYGKHAEGDATDWDYDRLRRILGEFVENEGDWTDITHMLQNASKIADRHCNDVVFKLHKWGGQIANSDHIESAVTQGIFVFPQPPFSDDREQFDLAKMYKCGQFIRLNRFIHDIAEWLEEDTSPQAKKTEKTRMATYRKILREGMVGFRAHDYEFESGYSSDYERDDDYFPQPGDTIAEFSFAVSPDWMKALVRECHQRKDDEGQDLYETTGENIWRMTKIHAMMNSMLQWDKEIWSMLDSGVSVLMKSAFFHKWLYEFSDSPDDDYLVGWFVSRHKVRAHWVNLALPAGEKSIYDVLYHGQAHDLKSMAKIILGVLRELNDEE